METYVASTTKDAMQICNYYIYHFFPIWSIYLTLLFLQTTNQPIILMAIARIRSRLSSASPAQPPSPMPNPRISNPPFNNYVDKLKNIPEFDIPDDITRPQIAEVEYRLIKSKDKKAIQLMLESATKYGVFRVSGHGISPEELQAAFTEAEFCFGLLAERWSRDGDREEFAWSRSAMTAAERRKEVRSDDQFHKFR